MKQTGKSALRLKFTLGTTTLLVGILSLAGIVILVSGSLRPELAIAPSTHSGLDIALLLSMPALLAVVIAFGSSADRRCADDYAVQLFATSAMVGMFTMIGANCLWALDFLRDAISIRGMRGQDMLAIGMLGWGVGYLTFRIKGLR